MWCKGYVGTITIGKHSTFSIEKLADIFKLDHQEKINTLKEEGVCKIRFAKSHLMEACFPNKTM